MAVREIKKGVYAVGAVDWDRTLFDELIPLPQGTSYNSYFVDGGGKNALIDTVDPAKSDELLKNLEEAGVEKLDYIVANHAEQDHSGSIPLLLEKYPEAKVVTNEKCMKFLKDLLEVPEERCMVINDGDELSLGNKTLRFIFTPWVHWPETMSTYLKEDRIMFTCDFFGSHLATSDLYGEEHEVYMAAKRYYAEIMMPYRQLIRKNIRRIGENEIEIIAPSHGPLYKNPEFIMDAYTKWSQDEVKNEVVIAYVSMHGSTEKIVRYLTGQLMKRGISVHVFNLSVADIGEIAMSLVDDATLILAAPTVLGGVHPVAIYTAYLVNALRPKLKNLGIITSYGWGGRAVDHLKAMITNINPQIMEPVLIKGLPKDDDYWVLDLLAEEIYKKHKALGIIEDTGEPQED